MRSGKGGKARRLPLHSAAQRTLTCYLQEVRCPAGMPPIGGEQEREALLVGMQHASAGRPLIPGIKASRASALLIWPETITSWFRQHPSIHLISRDRGKDIASGARLGAPATIHVADRFHLLVNLRQILEHTLFCLQTHLPGFRLSLRQAFFLLLRSPDSLSPRQQRDVDYARILQTHHIPTTVFEWESYPDERLQGGSLDLHPESGLLARLDEPFRAIARYEDQGMRRLSKDGQVLFEMKPNEGPVSRPEVDRAALRSMLLNSLAPGMIRWGFNLRSVRQTDDGSYELRFENGLIETFNLVVGADGA